MHEGSLSARVAFLDEFGRVIAVDDLDVPASLDTDGPVARKVAELLDEARAGLDPDKCYAEDPRWVSELELTLGEYLAGGFGDLEEEDELRGLFEELEGFYADAGEGGTPPEASCAGTWTSRSHGVCEDCRCRNRDNKLALYYQICSQ